MRRSPCLILTNLKNIQWSTWRISTKIFLSKLLQCLQSIASPLSSSLSPSLSSSSLLSSSSHRHHIIIRKTERKIEEKSDSIKETIITVFWCFFLPFFRLILKTSFNFQTLSEVSGSWKDGCKEEKKRKIELCN